jgi:hypothetical protein
MPVQGDLCGRSEAASYVGQAHTRTKTMKKSIVVLSILTISSLYFSGCTTTYGRYDPEEKHALRTLTGGVLGGLLAGSTGGAIVGAMAVDIFTLATVKYDDKKLYDRDEARKRYEDEFQAEKLRDADKKAEELKDVDKKAEEFQERDKKAEELNDVDRKVEELQDRDKKAEKLRDADKKAEELKDVDKKAEELQERDRKAEQPREIDKKAEELQDADKKAEKLQERDRKAEQPLDGDKRAERKKGDERVKLFIEKSSIGATNVYTGSTVKANVQYTLLASGDTREVTITETRILANHAKTMELGKREIVREQGTYSSTITFPVPEDMPRGYCILYTTISDGKYTRTTKSVLNII